MNEVTILLSVSNHELVLNVRDQGVGFEPDAMRLQAAVGIDSMEERVHLVHGRFAIRSEPGKGTDVEVRIPLTEDHDG